MTRIDLISATDYGYNLIWGERHYLLRLAAFPLIMRFLCLAAVLMLGWENNAIRMVVVMLPAILAEGWMLSHLARLVFYGQRWPFTPSGNAAEDEINLRERATCISAGAVAYALIQVLLSGFMAFFQSMDFSVPDGRTMTAPPDTEPWTFLAAIVMMVFTIWIFKFVFYYILAATGQSLRLMRGSGAGLLLSVRLMGIWLLTFVPLMMIFVILGAGLAKMLFPAVSSPLDLPVWFTACLLAVQSVVDITVSLIVTAAIARGFYILANPQVDQ